MADVTNQCSRAGFVMSCFLCGREMYDYYDLRYPLGE